MNNGDTPINPLIGQNGHTRLIDYDNKTNKSTYSDGLTKREHFAGLAMQGILASDIKREMSLKDIYKWSVKNADALLKELDK